MSFGNSSLGAGGVFKVPVQFWNCEWGSPYVDPNAGDSRAIKSREHRFLFLSGFSPKVVYCKLLLEPIQFHAHRLSLLLYPVNIYIFTGANSVPSSLWGCRFVGKVETLWFRMLFSCGRIWRH